MQMTKRTFYFLATILFVLNFSQAYAVPRSQAQIRKTGSAQRTETSLKVVASTVSSEIQSSAVKAVAKLLSTCGIGAYAAQKGILDSQAISVLSKMVFNIFQPCLLFVNVCETVAAQSAVSGSKITYLLPMVAVFQIMIGYIVGKIVTALPFFKFSPSRSKQLLACTTFGNSGPLPLVFTDALFRMSPDKTLLPKSVAYISLYLLGWSPIFWVLCTSILSKGSDKISAEENMKLLKKSVLSPPVMGSVFGLIVGSIGPLRELFINGVLKSVFEAMRTLGAGYLPAVLLVLAGSLISPQPAKDETLKAAVQPTENSRWGFIQQISVVYLCRFLLMPSLLFAIINSLKVVYPSMHAYLQSDKLLLFILLLEACMPSAQNSVTIQQLAGDKEGANMMAKTLLAIYALGTPAITFWLMKILHFTDLTII